jgi:hypothetical protein
LLRHLRSFVLVGAVLAQAALVPSALAAGLPAGVDSDSPTIGLLDSKTGFDQRARDLKYPDAALTSAPPRFVHQTLNNCAFASASMLIDKWTGGTVRPSQNEMRAASGVPQTDGVTFSQLSRAVASVTRIDMRFSPRGRDALTWDELMARLAKGAGAVIGGDYSDLPRHYQRWAPGFAALGPKLSGHAMYVERYQPGRDGGRVWLMDPLGRGRNFSGEWISAKDLRAFIWRYAGGFVAAAATPEPQPLSGYRIRDPQLLSSDTTFAGDEVSFRLPIRVRAGWRKPDNLALATNWLPITLDPDPAELTLQYREAIEPVDGPADAVPSTPPAGAAKPVTPGGGEPAWHERAKFLAEQQLARSMARGADSTAADDTTKGMVEEPDSQPEAKPDDPAESRINAPIETMTTLTLRGRYLEGKMVAPVRAGTYQLWFELRDADGDGFAEGAAPRFQSMELHVVGPLAAEYGPVGVADELYMGSAATISVDVTNTGSSDWVDDDAVQLIGAWETVAGPVETGSTLLELGAGDTTTISLDVMIPTHATRGTLALELVTVGGVPFTALGLEPNRVELEFALPTPEMRAEQRWQFDTN